MIVKQKRLASLDGQQNAALFGFFMFKLTETHGSSKATCKPPVVATRHNFNTASFCGSGIERRPYLQLRWAIEPPEYAIVLMPRQVHPRARRLVPQHSPIERGGWAKYLFRNSSKQWILNPRHEQCIELEFLDLAISQGRAHPAGAKHEIFVVARIRIVLVEEPRIAHLTAHQRVGALTQKLCAVVAEHRPKPRIAVASEFGEWSFELDIQGATQQH